VSAEPPVSSNYARAGVDVAGEESGLQRLLGWVNRTLAHRPGVGRALLPNGFFANVLDLGGVGLAISTDGVGTKLIVAQQLGRYDTVGIDCVAMNVNDVLCVGAEPVAIVDYIAVQAPHPDLLEALAKGLYEGARQANVSIPGGEIAQVRELISGERPGYGFDLVATAVGVVRPDRIIVGREVRPGDAVVGLLSSGVHSNGLTLARRVLFAEGRDAHTYVPEVGRTLGEELLEPTRIYVREVLAMLEAGCNVTGLAHITSDGFTNLLRLDCAAGFVLDDLPEPPPVFRLIQRLGRVSDAEMHDVFNMGVGFCVVVDPEDAERCCQIAAEQGGQARVIGRAVAMEERAVHLPGRGLVGTPAGFRPA